MENKINIAKLLKDCPKGMELDCTIIDNVVFEKLEFISSHYPIIIRRTDSNKTIHLTKYGQYSDEEDYKCVIFPKGKATWEGFVPPCKFKKESEDEKIKTAILNHLKKMCGNSQDDVCGIHVEDAIAWLKKQVKQELMNFDEAEKEKSDFVGDGFIKCFANFLEFKEGETYWLEYIGDDKYNVRSDNLFGNTYHITPCQLYTIFKKLTWLEKQCEKPQGKSALEAINEEKVDNQKCVKPTDKVKSKFEDGDVISDSFGSCIFKGEGRIKGTVDYYCGTLAQYFHVKDSKQNHNAHYGDIVNYRLATEEEKQKLFDTIEANGYKWNPKTKTLEKLQKFKVGDKVRHKTTNKDDVYEIDKVYDDSYGLVGFTWMIYMKYQDQYELVPNKFDINTLVPFESKVLVRAVDNQFWRPAIWGVKHCDWDFCCVLGGEMWEQCIPYEGNEHLLGTTDDCDKYFKIWER